MKAIEEVSPNQQQLAIIEWALDGTGHLMIEALAGCGKTSTLMMLLSYIEGEVFMGAFNAAIKKELAERIQDLNLPNCNVAVKTLHAAGLSAIYASGHKPSIMENKMALLVDDLYSTTKDEDFSTHERFIIKLVGFAKRAGVGVLASNDEDSWMDLVDYYSVTDELPDDAYDDEGEVPERLIKQLIKKAQKAYQVSLDKWKDEIDFDDMLLIPIFYNLRVRKYDWVMIDEVQDCSAIRQELAVRMLKAKGRIVGVGDRNQCIYIFSGVAHGDMDNLINRLQMKTLPLSVTYRCPKKVVGVANTWVPELEAAPDAADGVVRSVDLEPQSCKKCNGSGRGESQRVTDGEVLCGSCGGSGKAGPSFWDEMRKLGPECVVLCRNNRPLVELAYQLLKRGVACQIEGRDFASSLIKLCHRWRVRELDKLQDRLIDYRKAESKRWRDRLNEARAAAVEDKVDTLLALIEAVQSSGKTRVIDLTDRINVMFGDTRDGDRPRVLTLSTCHKAKGKQWPVVYILGRNRYMPSRWAKQPHDIQCERNIQYVAVTRSMRELVDVIVPTGKRRKE